MNRTGLVIALGVAAAVGVLFALDPQLDLRLSALFFGPQWPGNWVGIIHPLPLLRHVASWIIAAIAAPAFVALALKFVLPRRRMLIPGRAAVFMVITLALAPGLIANVMLKNHWARPRPFYVTEFNGKDQFLPWWDPRGSCPDNCSFVAGEPSGAFWTLAPAALVPPAWRALAYTGALVFGAAVGVLRMAGGGHFFTDVVFSGVFTYLTIWLVYAFIYRWRSTRITDKGVERAIERLRGFDRPKVDARHTREDGSP
jgi:membrane-associated PAP2 superfamily phosphatase